MASSRFFAVRAAAKISASNKVCAALYTTIVYLAIQQAGWNEWAFGLVVGVFAAQGVTEVMNYLDRTLNTRPAQNAPAIQDEVLDADIFVRARPKLHGG